MYTERQEPVVMRTERLPFSQKMLSKDLRSPRSKHAAVEAQPNNGILSMYERLRRLICTQSMTDNAIYFD